MKLTLISIVIIEYNSLPEVNRSVLSLENSLKNIEHEIIISSNSSYDTPTQNEIARDFPGVRWVFNSKNSGFASAMNKGLEKAEGRFLVIMNPDVVVIDGFPKMLEFIEMNHDVGAVGPKMIDDGDRIQDSCRPYVSLHKFLLRQFNRIILRKVNPLEKEFDYNVAQTVDWLSGAFIMVRKELYSQTNGLNPAYFLYAEDMDWCTRIRLTGSEIVYFPHMMVRYSATRMARRMNKFTLIFLKSHIIYWRKFGFFSGYPERIRRIYK